MGTSIAIALRSQLRRGMSRKQLSVKVLKRTVILFFLGLVVSNGNGNGLYKLKSLSFYAYTGGMSLLIQKTDTMIENDKDKLIITGVA